MKLKSQNTYKHLLNFTAKSASRPILQGIHIDGEGNITATDAHILMKLIRHVQVPVGTDIVLHPKEMRTIQGRYPDTSRLIPKKSKTVISVRKETFAEIKKFLKAFGKNENVKFSVIDDHFKIEADEVAKTFKGDVKGPEVSLICNGTYLDHICSYVVDCVPLGLPIDIKIEEPLKPMVFEAEGQFQALLTPIRSV